MVSGKTIRRFRPRILVVVIVMLVLVLLISLGNWQMDRSREKQSLLDRYELAPTLPVVGYSEVGSDWEKYRFRTIEVSGYYDERHQVLLENQVRNSQTGYMVLTPFYVENDNRVVMVNRGWLSQDAGAREIPAVSVSTDHRSLIGLINHPPEVGMRIGSLDDSRAGWPKIVPYMDTDWLALQLGVEISPWIILLDENAPDGYIREWMPSVRMPPEKHKGYAFQWYSLAIVLIFLFVVGSMRPEGDDRDDTQDEQS
jgi:surfeit locus 1 family protein